MLPQHVASSGMCQPWPLWQKDHFELVTWGHGKLKNDMTERRLPQRGSANLYIGRCGGSTPHWQMGTQQGPITEELRLGLLPLFDILPTFFSLG